jgi:hypothetical protein
VGKQPGDERGEGDGGKRGAQGRGEAGVEGVSSGGRDDEAVKDYEGVDELDAVGDDLRCDLGPLGLGAGDPAADRGQRCRNRREP